MRRPRVNEIRAGWWLATGLLVLEMGRAAVGPGSDRIPACERPSELEASGGHTRRVQCGEAPVGAPVRGPARVLFGLGLDPNRADAAALEALPGVGPARAAAIVADRTRGDYRSLADLGRVPGIGPVTLRRAAPWLSFGASRPTASAGAQRAQASRSEPKASEVHEAGERSPVGLR